MDPKPENELETGDNEFIEVPVFDPVTVKADTSGDEWALDVLVPYGGPKNGRDSQDEYFSPRTNFHEDRHGLPPFVHYHGFDTKTGQPTGEPEYIGRTVSRTAKSDGIWYRVILDRAGGLNSTAARMWDAAKAGMARISPGSAGHLVRKERDGHLTHWPIVELSGMDLRDGVRPANAYAVALVATKAIYAQAGLDPSVLDQTADEPEAQPETPAGVGGAATSKSTKAQDQQEDIDMDENRIQEMIAAGVSNAVTAALKAQADEAKAAKEAEEKRQADIAEAVKAERTKWEADATKGRRLPDGGYDGTAYVTQFGDTAKYDDLELEDVGLMTSILQDAQRKGNSVGGASEGALKALAIRVADSNEEKRRDNGTIDRTLKAMQALGMPLKANELNQSTLANYGDEWVVALNSTNLWESIRLAASVAAMIPSVTVPQGVESIKIPLESTPPTFYKVAQASAQDTNTLGRVTPTVTSSKMGTASQSLTVAKMGARTIFSGELEEDSMIPWMPQVRRSIEKEGAEVLDHIVIDGDTEAGATANINDIAATPGGTEAFLLFNGLRKLALVTNTANSRSAGTLTVEDFLETVKLLGLAGKNAVQKDAVGLIIDLWTHWKALELQEVKTRDVSAAPTIENGVLTGLWNYRIIASPNMHRANQDATYGLKANTSGKVDLDTAANNTTGSILAVRWDQWLLGFKRRMTVETTRIPIADATEIVALTRVGLVNRDTEASAISYNVTV